MTLGVHHVAIKVRDLVACERFYRDVLGLKVIRRWPSAHGNHDRSVWLGVGHGVGVGVGDDRETFLALERIADADPGANARATATAPRGERDDHDGRRGGVAAPGEPAADIAPDEAPDEAPNEAFAGLHLLALRIRRDQRATWETRLAAAGVTVSHRTAYTIYFADPEGNRLGLSHYPDAEPAVPPARGQS